MAFITLNLGASKTGLTDLRAVLLDSDSETVSTVSTGFTELSNGQYTWSYSLPAGISAVRFYSNAAPSDVFCTVAVITASQIPASGDVETVNAYIFTRNSLGVITAGMTLNYQQVGIDPDAGSAFDDDVQSVESDGDGLIELDLLIGGYYRYWIGSGNFRTVHITDETADPFPLPEVRG